MYLLAFAESIQLFPDGTLFIHIGLILLMIWILNRTFFRPINRVIESREKHSGGRNGEAETILKEVSEKQASYNHAILEARSEGYELIEKQRAEAVATRLKKIGDAKTETAQTLSAEKQNLLTQTEEARVIIAREAEEMAEKISANILRA